MRNLSAAYLGDLVQVTCENAVKIFPGNSHLKTTLGLEYLLIQVTHLPGQLVLAVGRRLSCSLFDSFHVVAPLSFWQLAPPRFSVSRVSKLKAAVSFVDLASVSGSYAIFLR